MRLGCIIRPEIAELHASLTIETKPLLPAWSRNVSVPRIGKSNLTIGDCACVAAVMRVQSEMGSEGNYTPIPEEEAIRVYSAVTGYDPSKIDASGFNPTDNGTDPEVLFAWWKDNEIAGRKLASFQRINPINLGACKNSIIASQGLYICMQLSTSNQGQNPLMPDGTKGSWGGHAEFDDGYIANRFDGTSWAQELSQTDDFFTSGFVSMAYSLELSPV